MINHLRKILCMLRKIFCRRPGEDINPDDFYHSKRSAEGWELVDDLNNPAIEGNLSSPPAGSNQTDSTTPRIKSSLPPYPVIWVYFIANGYPDVEALHFYRRFQVMGWNERIIPALDHWQELADHWMHQARQSPNSHNKPQPPNDTHPGSDNNPAGPV
jgi:hypothetical protein